MLPPCVDLVASMLHRSEPMLVETGLPEPTVEALDKRILSGLSRLDEVQLHTVISGPEEHRLTGQLGAVVADDGSRQRAIEFGEEPGHPGPGDRGIDELTDALATEVIDDIQDSEASAVSQLVGHEINRPALIRLRWHEHRYSRPGQLLTPLGADLEPLLRVNPMCALMVAHDPLVPEHGMQGRAAITRVLLGQRLESGPKVGIVGR